MKILVIGGGGREHALIWKLAQSSRIEKIYAAPGNGGTRQIAENVPISATDIKNLVSFAAEKKIDFVVMGPDDPLSLGIVDEFKKIGVPAFGPTKAAARIESSKAFAKKLMAESGIPTAEFAVFKDFEEAKKYVAGKGKFPIVVKASGLALGKGVTIAKTFEEAETALRQIMVEKIFGDSGSEVVIEEFLTGREVSIHAVSDSNSFRLFPPSQDHKTIFENDRGPNTGGMGAVAPLPWVTKEMMAEISSKIVEPALEGLRRAGTAFTGVLYPGLMMTDSGPKVLEFNARFGDPETESYMRILKTPLLEILESSVSGGLKERTIEWEKGYAACVFLVSGGYPGKYEKGKKISGFEEASKTPEVEIFHMGTIFENGDYYTSGGRVLGVTGRGKTLKEALDRAYGAAGLIKFEGVQYRKDIGAKALKTAL